MSQAPASSARTTGENPGPATEDRGSAGASERCRAGQWRGSRIAAVNSGQPVSEWETEKR